MFGLVLLTSGVFTQAMSVQLDLLITHSRSLVNTCKGVHGLALCALPFSAAGTFMQVLLAMAILASLWHYQRRVRRENVHGGMRIRLSRDGDWEVSLAAAPFQAARLATPVFVRPLLTVLRFRLVDGRRCCALLLPDCVDAEDFRRLRVWLRYGFAGSD